MVLRLFAVSVGLLLEVCIACASCSLDALERFENRFEIREELIYDRKLRLTWDRCTFGKIFKSGKCIGSAKFVGLDEAKQLVASKGSGWRIPNVEELSSLLDKDCHSPAVSTTVFGDVDIVLDGGSPYWTSSKSWLPDTFYYIDFIEGFVDAHSPGFPLEVRFVKG